VVFVDSWLEIARQSKHIYFVHFNICSLEKNALWEKFSNWYELQGTYSLLVVREYILDNLTSACTVWMHGLLFLSMRKFYVCSNKSPVSTQPTGCNGLSASTALIYVLKSRSWLGCDASPQKSSGTHVALANPQLAWFNRFEYLVKQRTFLGVTIFTAPDIDCQSQLWVKNYEGLPGNVWHHQCSTSNRWSVFPSSFRPRPRTL